MPNRDIKESCRHSPTLAQLSDFAERLFWRLTTVADDWGRFPADPRYIRAECFPLFDKLQVSKVISGFEELITTGMVESYQNGERTYGEFRTWKKHQRCRSEKSKYPSPADADSRRQPLANVPDLRSPIPDQDPKDRSPISRSLAATGGNGWQNAFQKFWEFWPYRVARGQAETTFEKLYLAGSLPPLEDLERAVKCQRREGGCLCPGKTSDGRDSRPHPSTWLNAKRWLDEDSPERKSNVREFQPNFLLPKEPA